MRVRDCKRSHCTARYAKHRHCNYCMGKLRPIGMPRFYTGILDDGSYVAQWDMGRDRSITFKTRKGKVMDFCDDHCRHMFYYGHRVPMASTFCTRQEFHEELGRIRYNRKHIFPKGFLMKTVRWVLGLA